MSEMKKMLLAALIATTTSFCFAEMSIKDFKKYKNEDSHSFYVLGVGMGYSMANIQMIANGQKPMYCVPKKLVLNQDNYMALVNEGINEKLLEKTKSDSVELLLLLKLQKQFPCK